MLNAIHGVMLYSYTYTYNLCLMLYKGVSYMFIAIYGVKH